MIKQPEQGRRNVNDSFYEHEGKQISLLNEIFSDVELSKGEMRTLVWLAGWEESTVRNIVSAVRKAMTMQKEKFFRQEEENEQPDFITFQKNLQHENFNQEYRKNSVDKEL
ncbi:hypothetical protein P0G10_18555 [Eubacteriales bacterium DFI.9.88]|nr:hypothetical protein [Eubacteriales bacterium DFI.9.88]